MLTSYKDKKHGIIIIVSFVLLGFFCISAYFEKQRLISLYQSGIEKIEEQDYQGAQDILSELGDYKDSLEYMELASNSVAYDRAMQLLIDGNYEKAEEEFLKLGDFKDSKQNAEKAKELLIEYNNLEQLYNEAYTLYIAEDYQQAIYIFMELGDYNESQVLFQECSIKLARLQQATTVSAGIRSSVGISSDGKIYLSGSDDYSWEKELDSWDDIVSISVKGNFVTGLKCDGTVVVAGYIPQYYVGTNSWNDIIAISTGQQYIIGLRVDGTLVAQGHNGDGQADINDWTDIVAIATGWRHTVGLDSNGTIHITGYRSEQQLKQIEENKAEWTDIVAISAGGGSDGAGEIQERGHTVALKQDGTVVAVGDNEFGQCNVYGGEWTDIIAISAGDFHTVGLKSDGTVVTTQTGNFAEKIAEWTDIVAVSAGYGFTLGLKSNGEVVGAGYNLNGQIDTESWKEIVRYEKEWKSIFSN